MCSFLSIGGLHLYDIVYTVEVETLISYFQSVGAVSTVSSNLSPQSVLHIVCNGCELLAMPISVLRA